VVERAYGSTDMVIYLDESLRDDSLQDPRQVAYLPCGVEDPLPPRASQGVGPRDGVEVLGSEVAPAGAAPLPPVVLFLGNLFEAKGTHVLARAAGVLTRRGIELKVVLAGPAPSDDEQARLDELIDELDLGDRVDRVGPVDGAAKDRALADATVFCFPTYFEAEAMPLVVFEAMAHGLPVVSTTWRGIPSQVVEGVTGYLVEPGDVEALADRLQLLLEDPELARAAGRRGRERFEDRFEVSRFRHGFEELILDALGERAACPR
jgi:glycosyltransferase involved in cell wall biosynthesis